MATTAHTKARILANVASPAAHAYDGATKTNHGGHPAFDTPLRQRIVQVLTTGTLSNTFYASAQSIAKDVDVVLREAIAKEPEFLAKALVYARNEAHMRLLPTIGLVYLSASDRKDLFKAIFPRVIRTPKDLSSFMDLASHSGIRNAQPSIGKGKPQGAVGTGIGRAAKTAVAAWLNGMDEYRAIKYGGESGQFSLSNIIRVAHPKAKDAKQHALFRHLRGLEVSGEQMALLPQVSAFQRLKATADANEQCSLIETGRLPYEAVAGVVKPDVETWAFLMRQMPHFALLRHLNTLERNGVFAVEANVDFAVDRLTDEKAIANAKVLPLNYYAAWKAYAEKGGGVQRIQDAIITALEASFVNLPDIKGHVVIGVDVSGSMSSATSDLGTMSCAHIAAIYAAALMKKCDSVRVIPFNDGHVNIPLSKNDSILTNAGRIVGNVRGGTNVGVPMHLVNRNGWPCDVFIGITDNVEWATRRLGGFEADGFYGEWMQRRNKGAKAFLLNVQTYDYQPAPAIDPSVTHIYGWSNTVPQFIAKSIAGLGGQVAHVEAIDLAPKKAPAEAAEE